MSTVTKPPTTSTSIKLGGNTFNLNLTAGGMKVGETGLNFDGNGAEVGFFFVLSLLAVFFLLNQLDGKVFRMKIFLMNRDFHLVKSEAVVKCFTKFIRLMTWFALSIPFLALGVWTAGLLVRAKNQGIPSVAGITVALVGAALFFFLLNFFRIKWNHFKFDIKCALYFCLTFLFLTGYQFVAIFLNPDRTLFGMSAIFLSANCLIMMAIVFLQSAVKEGAIEDLIEAKIPKGAQPRDPTRKDDFTVEIARERDNKDFLPSTDDLNDIFTINKTEYRSRWEYPAYTSGLINFFGSLSAPVKRIVTLVLWVVATGILVVYSFCIKYYFPDNSRFGFIIMIAILTTDVLVYLI